MALSLKKVSNIDKDRQCTIYGYIRQYEQSRQINIPEGIILVLILFYGNEKDDWDPNYISKYMKLSDRTVTQISHAFGSSYGKRIMDSGIFKWRLKINQCENNGFIFGIRRVGDPNNPPPTHTWFTNGGWDSGYAFRSRYSRLTDDDGYALGKPYGASPENGSIIEMTLDLDELTLSYIIDGKDYGKAFDIKRGKYRMGFYMDQKDDSVSLL